jgi:hypothetical protein
MPMETTGNEQLQEAVNICHPHITSVVVKLVGLISHPKSKKDIIPRTL